MAEENIGANVQEVAEPATSTVEGEAATATHEEGVAKGEVATATQKQSAEDNSKFAKMRREMEASSNKVAELEKQLAAHKELSRAISDVYGYDGDPQMVKDMILANDRGISVEQLQAERAKEAAKVREMVENDPAYKDAVAERDRLQDVLIRDRMARDIEALKAAHPEITADSVEDLGEDFGKLIGLGWSAEEAYSAIQAKSKSNQKTPPPSIGSVKSQAAADKEFYTPEEVDRITREDLRKDPTLMDKIKRSMAKWH